MVFRLVITISGLLLGVLLGLMTYNWLIDTMHKTGEFERGLSGLAGVGVFIVITFLGSELGKALVSDR